MVYLYDKLGKTNLGTLDDVISCFVIEERNGIFDLELEYPNGYPLSDQLQTENIIICDANDTLKSQKFRIYDTQKLMDNTMVVFARHISFDLMYDYIDGLSFENQSCEYALNQLFRNSNFSTHYKGYSDIVNAQKFNVSMLNILEAIGGKSGSIIDTFGNGAEILRDNENIHILNKRGYDNEVTIEYRKNLTGFELEEDTTDLVTRILPYAKYNDAGTSEEITVKANFVDSPLINNYSHPYIKAIDYSDKFKDDEIPTVEKLINYAKREFNINKIDQPKQNFKIDFIPLSKCVGYEGLEDKISLCDTVTIIDTRYNINTQAKVIKTVFNVLKNRYESIELGEPKTSLGDVIGSGGDNEPVVGPPGPQGPPGEDGNLGDFPNSLPAIPILESLVYGFSNIELTWSFENKIYYQYELYASKTKDFTPNTFDLIFQGQASSYMFQAKPNETWYFKVCAINTYGERTEFSNQVTVTTTKIEDLSNYVENMAINEALIGTLSLDRGWIGKLNANLLDVKGNFSVTDGNGKRTLDIDSFGNVNLDVSSLKISAKNVATQDYTNNTVNTAKNEAIENANSYTDGVKEEFYTNLEITANGINSKVSSLNDKYTEIKQTIEGIDLTGKVSFSDLSTKGGTEIHGGNISTRTITADKLKVGTITANEIASNTITASEIATGAITASEIATGAITADKIKTGSISVDMITQSSTNPVLKLFGNSCAIDATQYMGQGIGNAIRLKKDDNNYLYVGNGNIALYCSGSNNNESALCTFNGNSYSFNMSTKGGFLSLNSGVFYNNNKLAYENHTHSGYASSSHTHSGYASSSHTHSNYLPKESTTICLSGSHSPYYTNTYNLGWSQERWEQCVARMGYFTNTYASAIDNPVATITDNSIDDILDDIIIESPNVMRMSDEEKLNEKLVINVNALKENKNAHLFVSKDDGGKVVVNESSLLALALLEIQKLKQEIKDIKKIDAIEN